MDVEAEGVEEDAECREGSCPNIAEEGYEAILVGYSEPDSILPNFDQRCSNADKLELDPISTVVRAIWALLRHIAEPAVRVSDKAILDWLCSFVRIRYEAGYTYIYIYMF